ncbi:hypothetical protein [Fluviispira multicolorata]|uniref:DUF3828 domain-containing protein n=1 Tax=Fluviispira multicolorata TaxID=2654512 RepID=A0A833N6M0_9BACT|nr:hypothetical protein [Fluviispira multicolorata]KAB8033655.1 hypothetical protein GCL57_02805 [Fluviispira multicolorata]
MKKKHLCLLFILMSQNVSGFEVTQLDSSDANNNFCSVLGDLLSKNYENRIITNNIIFKYTSLINADFSRIISYYIDYYYDINNDNYILKNCKQLSNNYVAYSINRSYPLIKSIQNKIENGPDFEIKFSRNENYWKIDNVTSGNCNDKIYTSIKLEYDEIFRRNKIIIPSEFYTHLKHQVENEECPAHSKNLLETFSKLIEEAKI